MNRVFRALLITLAFAVPGCFLSRWIFYNIGNARWAWWHSLGTPPGGAVRFVNLKMDRDNRRTIVYVETSRKQVFHCCSQENGGWQQSDLLVDEDVSDCSYDTAPHPLFSHLRGKVVDCTMVSWTMEWIRDDDFFVILEDGSVWKWRIYTGFDIQTAFQCGIPLAFIGLGWGVIALIRFARRSANRQGLHESA